MTVSETAAPMAAPAYTPSTTGGVTPSQMLAQCERQSKKRRKALAHDEYDKLLIELGEHWRLMCDLITVKPGCAGRRRRRSRSRT
jgi:hypothetical protein